MNKDKLIVITNFVIIIMFLFMSYQGTFLKTKVYVYTTDGEILFSEDYNDKVLGTDDFLDDLYNHYNFTAYDEENGTIRINIVGDIENEN